MNKLLLTIIFFLLGFTAVTVLLWIRKRICLKKNTAMNRKNDYYQETPNPLYENGSNQTDMSRPSNTAIIYKSELDYISRCILDYINIETGGQLFGYWTATGTPVVMYAIGPGINAQHNHTSFIQDWQYLQRIGKELGRRYRLQHIGEWHSHHQLGLAHPSGGDVNTMSYGVGKPGFPRLLLCIGNCTRTATTINAFNFHESVPTEYVHAIWDVVEMESPYRHLVDTELQHILIHPNTKHASYERIYSEKNIASENETEKTHWLTQNINNVETMKKFMSMVQTMYPSFDVKAEILSSGEPQIAIKGANVCIKLPYGFPAQSPIILNEAGEAYNQYCDNTWEIREEPLTETFRRWLSVKKSQIMELTNQASLTTDEIVDGNGIKCPMSETDIQSADQIEDQEIESKKQ